MIPRLLAAVFVLQIGSAAQSSQPPNTPAAPNQQESASIGTEQSPAAVRILPTTPNPEETAQAERERQRQASRDSWTIKLTGAIAFFTLCLIGVGVLQWRTYQATLAANKVIERAYVTMSHRSPGLKIEGWVTESASEMTKGDGVPRQNVKVSVGVTNEGNTPATVTCHLLHFFISDEPLPIVPPYEPRHAQVVRVSLVKGARFNILANFPMESTAVERIRRGPNLKLYLLGYVDYIDKFNKRHRSGYARIYNPYESTVAAFDAIVKNRGKTTSRVENNLPFVTQPGYNYDRERQQGEGNDWNDPKQS